MTTDPTQAAAPSEAPPVTPETPAPEPKAAETNPLTIATDLKDVDAQLAQLTAIRRGEAPAAEEPTPEPAAEPAKVETDPAAPATEEPPAEPAATEPVAKVLPGKIPTDQFNERDKLAIRTIKDARDLGETIDLTEALRRVDILHPKAAPEIPAASPVDTLTAKAADIDTKLADLRAKRKEFAVNETIFTPELEAVTTQIEDLISEKSEVASDIQAAKDKEQSKAARVHQTLAQKAASDLATAKAEALEEFPHAGDTTHPHGVRVAQLVDEWSDPAHPKNHLLKGSAAPMAVSMEAARQVAKEIATEKKIPVAQALASLMKADAPAKAPEVAKTTAPKTEPKTVPFRAATGATGTPPPAVQSAVDRLKAAATTTDPKEIDAILYDDRNTNRTLIGAR